MKVLSRLKTSLKFLWQCLFIMVKEMESNILLVVCFTEHIAHDTHTTYLSNTRVPPTDYILLSFFPLRVVSIILILFCEN